MDTEGGQQSNTVVVDKGGAQNILLNMRGVTRLDSSGIGELVAANSSITKDGGRLLLVGLPQKVATVLQITNLLGVLELFSDIDEAIAALEVESE
jgi:anti-sigma B factor antagonist